MFSKSNILATILGFVTMFLLGYAIWGVATVSFFEAHATNNIMKDPPDLLFIALGNLIGTFALSTIYGQWAAGSYSAANGFAFGIWIGIFVGLGMGLLWYGTSELMDMTGHLVEAILDIVFYGIIGAVIGFVYQKTKR